MLTITTKPKTNERNERAERPLPTVDAIPTDVLELMTEGFFQAKSLHDVLQKLLAVIDALAHPKTAFFLVFDPDKRELILEGMRGKTDNAFARSCHPGEGLVGQAFVRGEPIGDPRAFLAVPLRNRLSVFGVLCLCASRRTLDEKVWRVLLRQVEIAVNIRIDATGDWRGTDPNDMRSPIHRMRAKMRVEESQARVYSVLEELLRPITTMRSTLEVVLAHVAEVLPQAREPLQSCLSNSDRLTQLIGDQLLAQRLGSGDISLDKQPFGLRQLIREVVAFYERPIGDKLFRFDETSGSEIFVKGNRDQMRNVLIRLLENAIHYNRPGEPVCVTATCTPDQKAQIVIADDGVGIDPEDLPHVFQPFFRGRGALPVAGALGLGCTLARSIVRLHGGTIGIASALDHGTQVTITLPMYAGALGDGALPRGRALHAQYLLLVEDDVDYCQALSLMLETRGYRVEKCPLAPEVTGRILATTSCCLPTSPRPWATSPRWWRRPRPSGIRCWS